MLDITYAYSCTGFAFQFLVTPGSRQTLWFRLRQCMASIVFDASLTLTGV